VCSQCADVSNKLIFSCLSGRVDWTSNLTGGYDVDGGYPNATTCGYFLNLTGTLTSMMSGYTLGTNDTIGETLLVRTLPLLSVLDKTPVYGNGSINFPATRNPIMDALIVSAADGLPSSVHRHEMPVAHECMLSFCVQSISSSYDAGIYQEKVLKIFQNETTGPFPWETQGVTTPTQNGTYIIYNEDININGPPDSPAFGTSNGTASNIMMLFDNAFPSFYIAKDDKSEPVLRYKTWLQGPAYTRHLDVNPWLAPNNVSAHFSRMATGMTEVMRAASGEYVDIKGEAYSEEVYVRVRWAWLAFPLVLLVLTVVFLGATIWKTSNNQSAGVWKTSAMPSLIYGLPEETQTQLSSSSAWDSADGGGKKVRVKLLPNVGWRVSGQSFLHPLPTRKAQPPPGWI
jgi:hypothetical protein